MSVTARQKEILQIIADFIQEYGYSPSVREIADLAFLASTSTTYDHIEALCQKGLITKAYAVSRSIVITAKGKELLA